VADFRFSANALTLGAVRSDDGPVEHRQEGEDLFLELPRPLARGEAATISLTYSGTPRRGLVFAEGGVRTGYFTCQWMICDQDRPGDRASLDLRVAVPSGFNAAGSGVGSTEALVGDTLTLRWRETRPYAAYLYGFAASPMHTLVINHPRVLLVTMSSAMTHAELERAFADTGRMIDFFERRAGVPFPYRSYNQVVIDGSEAQEASGFSVLGTAEIRPILTDPTEDWAIAHELGHQWWGNLITCNTWREFWLNEGLTVFMTAAWKEERWGRAAYEREIRLSRQRWQAVLDSGFDAPLAWGGTYPSMRHRRAITYSKAAVFLDALRTEMGDRAFWAGLRAYTRANAGGTVESRDLQRAMEGAAHRSLAPLFNTWVYGERAG
jgi:aminopeptidase N